MFPTDDGSACQLSQRNSIRELLTFRSVYRNQYTAIFQDEKDSDAALYKFRSPLHDEDSASCPECVRQGRRTASVLSSVRADWLVWLRVACKCDAYFVPRMFVLMFPTGSGFMDSNSHTTGSVCQKAFLSARPDLLGPTTPINCTYIFICVRSFATIQIAVPEQKEWGMRVESEMKIVHIVCWRVNFWTYLPCWTNVFNKIPFGAANFSVEPPHLFAF